MKLSVLILVLFIFSLNIFGQENQSDTTKQHYISKGKFALQFQITEKSRLSDFESILVSGKYHFSPKGAVRFGFSTRVEYNSNNANIRRPYEEDYVNWIVYDYYSEISFLLQIIRYSKPRDNVFIFVTGGPIINYCHRKISSIRMYPHERPSTSNVGFNVSIGFDYFIKDNVSLQLEYGTDFVIRTERYYYFNSSLPMFVDYRYKDNSFNLGVYKGTVERHVIEPNRIKFGVSVYL